MGKLALSWQHVGPAREVAVAVPPISIGNYAYVLVHDPERDVLVYCHARAYGDAVDVWTYDGTWTKAKGKGPRLTDECHAFYDASRRGIAVWSVDHDHELERAAPRATLLTAAGAKQIKTTGEPPLIEPDSDETFFLSSNFGCAMAYDASRDVTVCVTRRGVWELDATGSWARVGEATGQPDDWHNDAGGTYDPVGKRCVFWIQGEDDRYAHVLLAWDGKTLARVPTKGLPELCIGLFNPCALFVGHPVHGVLCHLGGDRGDFALAGSGWAKLPEAANPPPLMGGRSSSGKPRIALLPKLDAIAIGPGYYEGDPGGGEAQRVFWFLRGGAWERQGAMTKPSELKQLYGRHHAAAGGSWYATNGRGLHTLRWVAESWELVVTDKAGETAIAEERTGGLAATPEGLVAVTQTGGVLRLEGKSWKRLAKPSPAFKERTGFLLAHDGRRLVAWGGTVKNRKVNDTLVFDGKTWSVVKASSPVPKDFKPEEVELVDFAIVHDAAIDRLVRFGYSEIATLEGEVWQPRKPAGYAVGGRIWEHVPAHDPVTGETLIVNFETRTILRFDLGGCVQVATFSYPKELVAITEREGESVVHAFAADHVFDPVSRSIHAQQEDDLWGRWRLDLGPAFEAAKRVGPRALPGVARPAKAGPTTLYKHAKGKVEIWRGGAAQVPAKRKAGFVPALELPASALETIGTRQSSALVVTKQKPAKHATSRMGGLPSGIPLDRWPKLRGKPLGFLFQLATGDRLAKHAAIAVFCTTDGSATEDESHNRVVLLTAADLSRAPAKTGPEGVPILEERAIAVEAARHEIDEEAIGKLTAKDADLAAAFERYQATAKVQDAACASKLGGAPVWLQSPEGGASDFVAQLDFDQLSLKQWRDAGLAGCIYVFARGSKADALWQYT